MTPRSVSVGSVVVIVLSVLAGLGAVLLPSPSSVDSGDPEGLTVEGVQHAPTTTMPPGLSPSSSGGVAPRDVAPAAPAAPGPVEAPVATTTTTVPVTTSTTAASEPEATTTTTVPATTSTTICIGQACSPGAAP